MSQQDVMRWIGRTEESIDTIRSQPIQFMESTLGLEPSLGDSLSLPPLWHWLFFLESKPISELGRDGHPQKGGFLPPVALPRRMWAGGRFKFLEPIPIEAKIKKYSKIKNIVHKKGRSGDLCFVTVSHDLIHNGRVVLNEEHDIVYREDPSKDEPKAIPPIAPDNAEVSELIQPSQVMLFRYSALTFNGHRIHYDTEYSREVEGYDGLVFHGPLTATLLVNLAQRTFGTIPVTFEFRGLAPISGMDAFHIEGRRRGNEMELWARRKDGVMAMKALATFGGIND